MIEEPDQIHQKLNDILKYEEEQEYWQDKLLELKMQEKRDTYQLSQSKIKVEDEYKNESQKNEKLNKEFHEIQSKISQLKKSQKTKDERLNCINSELAQSEKKTEEYMQQIKANSDFLYNIDNNIVSHYLTFSPEFKKMIYNICNDRLQVVLSHMQYQNQQNQQPLQETNENEVKTQPIHPNGMPMPMRMPMGMPNMNYPMYYVPMYYPPQQNNYPKPQ